MSAVECITLDGRKKMIQKDSLVFRPAVYGIVVHDGKVLLMTVRHTDKYHPPGGGITVGERIQQWSHAHYSQFCSLSPFPQPGGGSSACRYM